MDKFVGWLNDVLWSPPLIIICILVGLFFSLSTRFLQVRLIKDMLAQMFKGKSSEAGISSFQALSVALSGRVGTGNIAGVATAIGLGGPGALFWMWLIAFVGAATAYVESTLAQIYKVKQDGEYRGGPAYYIEKGTGMRWYGIVFAIATIISLTFLMPGVQANAIAEGLENAFGMHKMVTAVIIAVLLGIIIFGGVKRIAGVAQFVVPFMALGYILVSLIIVFINIDQVPAVFAQIFKSAFGADATFGGLIGSAIAWGVKRGIYSNEAGQGTGAHAAGAAEVSHPAKQGLVQAFSVYIDTWFVCTATGLMILFTGMFSTKAPDGTYLYNKMGTADPGPQYTQSAVESVLPGFGAGFVAISLFFFAFTTIMAYYYMSETNVAYLTRGKNNRWAILLIKFVSIAAVFYGCIKTSKVAWAFGDTGLGIMVWLNIIAVVILMKPALVALKDYERQKKAGKDPVFDPEVLGIKNADYWVEAKKGDKKEVS
ncbi:sodium:alanine symporter [Heyndrickxia sporothermodurans]|uniref:alanine/glycine:cation symporter family protein n=1 Tax=Heyndrickxia sporothermodurans TaxID=46224 RepID=UPI000D39ED1E|nr:alanine/glycine:cation symporter family protein [Heyndrickxia sporothermodurans]MBL5791736.1 alanine:cation symporter family protein [Heyndrickxia sporothermodurans]MBL5852859.1 alanine:cation symporter family protein [Heyndrickxia sporothermodurans]PTY81425.1 sodium:alanine symporter [Heyndrickxia sporothermodurans]